MNGREHERAALELSQPTHGLLDRIPCERPGGQHSRLHAPAQNRLRLHLRKPRSLRAQLLSSPFARCGRALASKQLREQLRIDARGRSSASTGLRPAHQPAHRSPLRAQYASLLLLLQSINEAPGLAAAQLEPYQVQNSLGVGEEDFVDPRTSAHRYQQQERLAPLRIGRRDNAQLRPLRDRSNHTVPLAASALAHIDPSRLQAVEAAADQLPHLLVGNPLLEATQYRQRVASSVSQLLQDAIHFVRMELAQHVG